MDVKDTNTKNSDSCKSEDSPVSAIKELAKNRKLQPEFKIIKEEGPQHEKTFVVLLTLGLHSWEGEGKSVKKAQMDASIKALHKLGVSIPTKVMKKTKIANPASLTPTVVLNGLAMARGESVEYKVVSKTPLPCQPIYNSKSFTNQQTLNWTKMYYGFDLSQSYNSFFRDDGPRTIEKPVKRWIYPQFYRIKVQVGDRTFVGEGKTQQTARHNAAQNALDVLEHMPVPKQEKKRNKKGKENKLPESVSHSNDTENETEPLSAKSPISQLYEKVSSHNLEVKFDIISETGPAHLKVFTMKAKVFKSVSEVLLDVEGVGHSKNIAKTNSAAAALVELNDMTLPEKSPLRPKNHRYHPKTNAVNDSSTKVTEIQSPKESLHPCSRLTQYLQAKKEKMPVYSEVSKTDVNKSKTLYVIQCSVLDKIAKGEGKSKKEAKREASENMLVELGISPSLKSETQQTTDSTESPKVTVPKPKNKKFKRKLKKADVLPTLAEV